MNESACPIKASELIGHDEDMAFIWPIIAHFENFVLLVARDLGF